MTELILFSVFLVLLIIVILYSIERAKPVTQLQWSILVDNVKNVQLSWKLPKNVDGLNLRLRINDDLVTATLPPGTTQWQFPVNVGSKVEAVVVVTFDGQEAPSKPVTFVVPAAMEPATELSWAVLPESDDSNEDLFDVDADGDGNIDYYLETKKPAAETQLQKQESKPLKLMVPEKKGILKPDSPELKKLVSDAVEKALEQVLQARSNA